MVGMSFIRNMLNVQRLSGKPKLRSYNLAEHSWAVTAIFIRLCQEENVEYTAEDLERVLFHDIVETVTNDLTYDVKNLNKTTQEAWETIENEVLRKYENVQIQEYTDTVIKALFDEKKLECFQAADLLELWFFLKEEESLGNSHSSIKQVLRNCTNLLSDFSIRDSVYKVMNEYKEY